MVRVKEWINQWFYIYDKNEYGIIEEYQRYKYKYRYRVCQVDSCEVGCGLRRCFQYLDFVIDYLIYFYYIGSQLFVCGDILLRL